MTNPTLQQHELSALFPPMTDAEYAELRSDIAANGLRQPITLFEGEVLDGWHRQRACVETGAAAHYVAFEGGRDAALKFVSSSNLVRRHLSALQKRELVAKLLQAQPGRSDRAIADIAKVSKNTVAAVRAR